MNWHPLLNADFWKQYGTELGGITAVVVAFGWLCKKFIGMQITKALGQYDKQIKLELQNEEQMTELLHSTFLKDYGLQLKIKDRAAGVAELLSLAFTPDCPTEKFNRLAWELSLWLPANIVIDLTHCLCRSERNIHPKQVLISVRKLLLGPDDTLEADNIVHRDRVYFSEKQRIKAEEIFAAVVAVQMALGSYYDKLFIFNVATPEKQAELKPALHAAGGLFTQLDRELLALQIRTGYYFDDASFDLVTEFRNAANEAFNTFIHYKAHTPAQVVDARKIVIAARDKLAARYREMQ